MTTSSSPIPFPVPLELRAAVESIVARQPDRILGKVIGNTDLVRFLLDYAPNQDDGRTLIALLASEQELIQDLGITRRPCVVFLHTSPMYNWTRRFRAFRMASAPDRPKRSWAAEGYRRESSIPIQGPGSLFWMMAGRFANAAGRHDLFDRCRFNERRTMIASPASRALSTFGISTYRSIQ